METLRREGKIFFSKHENWIFPIRKFILGDFNSMESIEILRRQEIIFFSNNEKKISKIGYHRFLSYTTKNPYLRRYNR